MVEQSVERHRLLQCCHTAVAEGWFVALDGKVELRQQPGMIDRKIAGAGQVVQRGVEPQRIQIEQHLFAGDGGAVFTHQSQQCHRVQSVDGQIADFILFQQAIESGGQGFVVGCVHTPDNRVAEEDRGILTADLCGNIAVEVVIVAETVGQPEILVQHHLFVGGVNHRQQYPHQKQYDNSGDQHLPGRKHRSVGVGGNIFKFFSHFNIVSSALQNC